MEENNNLKVLTSDELGITSKKPTLLGYVLSPRDISEAVITMLIKCGVPRDSIHSVKVAKEKDGIEITARVEEDAVKDKGDTKIKSLIGISERSTKLRIKPSIYNGLRNKAFIGNFHFQKEKIKGDNYVVLQFDTEVLLAFMLNINFDNEYLKISPTEFQVGKKQRRKLGYLPCGAVVTYENTGIGFKPEQVEEYYREDNER